MAGKVGLYITIQGTTYRSQSTFRISGFRFDGDSRAIEANHGEAPEGKKFTLLCKCGANDWTDDGRDINEYQCNCCGQFVDAYPFK